MLAQGQANRLPFVPEVIGSHWSRSEQADVVAVNWRERAILIGECKWSTDRVDRQIVRDLLDYQVGGVGYSPRLGRTSISAPTIS